MIKAVEKELRDLSFLMFSGVKVKYDRDSDEYEMADGSGIRVVGGWGDLDNDEGNNQ